MRENRLRWFDHIECKSNDAPVKIVEKIDIAHGKNLREKPKITWMEMVKKDIKLLELKERMIADKNDWRKRIYVLDRV